MAGDYMESYYYTPTYGGGFFNGHADYVSAQRYDGVYTLL